MFRKILSLADEMHGLPNVCPLRGKNEVYFCYKPTGLVSVLHISFLNGSILEEKKILQKSFLKKWFWKRFDLIDPSSSGWGKGKDDSCSFCCMLFWLASNKMLPLTPGPPRRECTELCRLHWGHPMWEQISFCWKEKISFCPGLFGKPWLDLNSE